MSRLIRNAIKFSANVKLNFENGVLKVSGKHGDNEVTIPPYISLEITDDSIKIVPKDNITKKVMPMLGTIRSLICNAIEGVENKFKFALQIVGTGCNASVANSQLKLQLGYSHPIVKDIPEGLDVVCSKPTLIEISGVNKRNVTQFGVEVQLHRKPIVYKGPEIKVVGKSYRKKAGKR